MINKHLTAFFASTERLRAGLPKEAPKDRIYRAKWELAVKMLAAAEEAKELLAKPDYAGEEAAVQLLRGIVDLGDKYEAIMSLS